MDGRDSFVFYRSFYEAIKKLKDKDKLAAYNAICNYALNGEDALNDGSAAAVYCLIKPLVDANNKRYENGKKGGRPPKAETEKKPKQNQSKTKAKANVYVNVNVNEDVNGDKTPISPFEKTLSDFIVFRKSNKKPMTDYAVELLRGRLQKLSQSEETQIAIMKQSIRKGWLDVFPLKEDEPKPQGKKTFAQLAAEMEQNHEP